MFNEKSVVPSLISENLLNRKFKREVKKEQKLTLELTKTKGRHFFIDEDDIFSNVEKKEFNNFKRFDSKLCGGSEQNFRIKKCGNCGKETEYKSNGKPVIYPIVCESSFCDNPACTTHRKLKAELLFNVFLWGNRSWIKERDIKATDLNKEGKLKSKLKTIKRGNKTKILYTRWGHWGFGFKRDSSLPERIELEKFRSNLNKFFKTLREELKIYVKGIGVRDLAYDVDLIGEEYYVHFHHALRPFNTNPKILKKINELGVKFKIKPVFFGYRECYELADYFSKRHAGQFEHDQTGTSWIYKDVMDKETYFRLFYNSRKLTHTGFTNKEVKYLKEMFKQKLKELNQALEESLLSSKDKEQSNCPHCHSDNIILSYFKKSELRFLRPPDPPPEPLKITTESIKRHICKSCFREYSEEDMQIKHLCKFCHNNNQTRMLNETYRKTGRNKFKIKW